VIIVHRLRGEPMFLNTDLIESIEATPDTVVTLVDGRKFVVAESPEEVVQRTLGFRASVLAAAEELRTRPSAVVVPLRGVERSDGAAPRVPAGPNGNEGGDRRNHR
jgi:flagellar protein FlbD